MTGIRVVLNISFVSENYIIEFLKRCCFIKYENIDEIYLSNAFKKLFI